MQEKSVANLNNTVNRKLNFDNLDVKGIQSRKIDTNFMSIGNTQL